MTGSSEEDLSGTRGTWVLPTEVGAAALFSPYGTTHESAGPYCDPHNPFMVCYGLLDSLIPTRGPPAPLYLADFPTYKRNRIWAPGKHTDNLIHAIRHMFPLCCVFSAS